MTDYVSYFTEMTHEHKESIFLGYLKTQLLLNNYLVATPEPDIGEDIWVANNNNDNYHIHPAQIKSAFMYQWINKGGAKRYVVNIKSRRFESTLQKKFYYFFGLYDPEHKSGLFHIACIPSSFFLEHWEFLTTTKRITANNYPGTDKQRINLYFDYYLAKDEYYAFSKPLVNVTRYFKDFSTIS
jgi:hypothetical protein